MSAIVDFPLERTRVPGAAFTHAAEVVIFPGVRVERRDFAETDTPQSRARSRSTSRPAAALSDD